MKKFVKKLTIISVVFLSAITFSGCDPMFYGIPISFSYESYGSYNPDWAPEYYNGARYYYFPDIECYYDLSTRNFIVLKNGQWTFVNSLSAYYPTFDLYNSFVVVLDANVYRPWLYNQYYISHYPRYYYRDYYDHSNIPYVRGFNENNRSAIYWSEKNRHNARSWDNRYVNQRNFKYSDADRQMQQKQRSSNSSKQNVTNQNRSSSTRTNNSQKQSVSKSSGTNYSGKTIGQPVKVNNNMRRPATESKNSNSQSSGTTKSSTSQSKTSSGRR